MPELEKKHHAGDWCIVSSDPFGAIASVLSIVSPLAACYQTLFVYFTIKCFAQNVEIIAAWIASRVKNVGFDGICWNWVFFFFFKPFPSYTYLIVPMLLWEKYKVFIKFPLAGNATKRRHYIMTSVNGVTSCFRKL